MKIKKKQKWNQSTSDYFLVLKLYNKRLSIFVFISCLKLYVIWIVYTTTTVATIKLKYADNKPLSGYYLSSIFGKIESVSCSIFWGEFHEVRVK